MIAEVFLTCALALPGAVMSSNGDGHREYLRMLLVNAQGWKIYERREQGLPTFGAATVNKLGITPFHAICEATALSFKRNSFFFVVYFHPNLFLEPMFVYLSEIDFVLDHGGFLAFNQREYPHWQLILRMFGWKRMPTIYEGMGVWQKPVPQKRIEGSALAPRSSPSTRSGILSYQAMSSEEKDIRDFIKKHYPGAEIFIHKKPQREILKEHGWERLPFNWKDSEIWIQRKPKDDGKKTREIERSA